MFFKISLGIVAFSLIIAGVTYFGFREFSQINNQLAALQEQIVPFLEKPAEEAAVAPAPVATSTVSEETAAAEDSELAPEPEKEINACDSLNCDGSDGWVNSGSTFTCQNSSSQTCTCQTQAYLDYSCSSSKQKCVYSTTNTRTSKYNCATPANPDLIFQSPGFSPALPNAGDQMFFWATLKNQGSGSAASSMSYLKIDGQKIAEFSTVSLASSGSVVVAWANGWPAIAGSHELEVCADGALTVAESNETNNCTKATLTVGGAAVQEGGVALPDLIVESIEISPSPLMSGQSVSFSATVKNRGSATSTPALTVSSLDLGNDGSWDVFPGALLTQGLGINANQTEIWRNAWTSVPGTHKIEVCADAVSEAELRMKESNESNNCLFRIVVIQ